MTRFVELYDGVFSTTIQITENGRLGDVIFSVAEAEQVYKELGDVLAEVRAKELNDGREPPT